MRNLCGHFYSWVDTSDSSSAVTLSTQLPTDLIERVRQFGTARNLSASAVIERAVLSMLAVRYDQKLCDMPRGTKHSGRPSVHFVSHRNEITLQELIGEPIYADESPDDKSVS